MSEPRFDFGNGRAVQHVFGSTYEWVDPITGQHLAYVITETIVYESSLDAQRRAA